jgi:hypothetical protein
MIWWFLGAHRVHGITKEKFVTIAIYIKMQHCYLYIACHATKVSKAVVAY